MTSLAPVHPDDDQHSLILASLSDHVLSTRRGYMGSLAERESRSLVPINFLVTKEELAAITRLVGSPRTHYKSNSDLGRHAIYELLQAYEDAGLQDSYLSDVMQQARAMREAAEQQRLRQEFAESVGIYETSLTHGMESGDLELIRSVLEMLRSFIERTPDRYWRGYLQRLMLHSVVIQAAVDVAYEGSRDDLDLADIHEEAQKWQIWMEGLQ